MTSTDPHDVFGDGHGFRHFQQRPPRPEPSGGKITIVSCRLTGWGVSEYDDTPSGGCDAMNRFYSLVLDKECVFVGLYGADWNLINHWYRKRDTQ
jgi:hypothetical protein